MDFLSKLNIITERRYVYITVIKHNFYLLNISCYKYRQMVKKQGEVLEMAFWPADLGKTCFISNFLCSGWGEYIS